MQYLSITPSIYGGGGWRGGCPPLNFIPLRPKLNSVDWIEYS